MCISLFLLRPSVLLKIVGERKTLMDSDGRAFSCTHSYFKKVSKLTGLHVFVLFCFQADFIDRTLTLLVKAVALG